MELRRLLWEVHTIFKWTKTVEEAFQQITTEVMSDTTLMAYNDTLPLVLAMDVSPVGLEAVLLHH